MPNIDPSQMSDDDLHSLGIQPQQAKPAQAPSSAIDPSQLSDEDLAGLGVQHAPSPIQPSDIGRSLEQGVTMGTGDELNAFLRSRGIWQGGQKENYDQALADERAKMAKFQSEHPVASTAAEIAGGLPMALAPGLEAYNGVRMLKNAKTAGSAALRAAGVGGAYGTISGFGHGQDGVGNRIMSGLESGATSAAIGLPLGAAGYKIGEVINGANTAKEEAGANGNMPATALRYLGTRFRKDNVDPVADIVNQQMLPTGRALTQDQMANIMTDLSNGATQQDLAARYGVGPGTIGRVVRLFNENTTTPMTMVDRAKMVRPGAGQNMEWGMRAAAATEGDARRMAMENLTDNQLGQYSRLMDAAQKYVGNGTDDAIQASQQALKNSENAIYKAAYQTQKPFDLNPALDAWNTKLRTEFGPSDSTAGALKQAMNLFYDARQVPNPLGTNYMQRLDPVADLGRFQNAKSQLDAMITKAGMDGNKFLSGQLQDLKASLMQQVRDTNPIWAEANDTFTGAGDRALQAGASLPLRLGSKSREIEKQFARYEAQAADPNPAIAAAGQAQMDLFRQSLSRTIQDGLQNKGQTNDLARTLVTPGAQRMLTRVLGQKQADAFNNILRQEQTTTSTFNKIRGGSQTAPLGEEIDAGRLPDLISSYSDIALHPMKLLAELGRRAAGKLYSERNAALMTHMSNLDPVEQMNALRSVNNVSAAQQAGGGAGALATVPAANVGTSTIQGRQQGLSGGMGPRYDQHANLLPGQDDTMKKRGGFADGGIADTDDEDTGGIMPYLESNPHGWRDQAYDPGSITSAGPVADRYGQKYGPEVGSLAQGASDAFDTAGGAAKGLALGLSGIDAAREGGANLAKAVDSNDPIAGAGSIAQIGMAAMPFTKYGRMAVETLPRALASSGIGSGAALAASGMLSSTDAEAKKQRQGQGQHSPQHNYQPAQTENAGPPPDDGLSPDQRARMQLLQRRIQNSDWNSGAERRSMESELAGLQGLAADYTRNMNSGKARTAEIAATSAANLNAQKAATAQADAERKAKLDQPFQERNPEASLALTAGAPVLSGLLARYGMGKLANRGEQLIQDFNMARQAGDVTAMSEAAAALSSWQRWLPMRQTAAIGVPATAPVDARVLGDVVDKYSLPPTSKAQQGASQRLGDVPQYLKDAVPAFGSGLVWSGIGAKLAPSAPVDKSRAITGMYAGKSAEDLGDILTTGANASTDVQHPLGRFEQAHQARLGLSGPSGIANPASEPQSALPPPAAGGLAEAPKGAEPAGGLGSGPAIDKQPSLPPPANTNEAGVRYEPGGPYHHIHFQPRNKRGHPIGPPTKILDEPPPPKGDGDED
jgi:hypothetical protein